MTGDKTDIFIFYSNPLHFLCLPRTEKRKTGGMTYEKSYHHHTIH